MADDAQNKPTQATLQAVRPQKIEHPTVRAFAAVRPEDAPKPERRQDEGGPSRADLLMAVMMLTEKVELLGGDVSEIRALLNMDGD